MAEKNYYEILGVAPSATQEEIKKAYEQLRLKNYPTSNPKNPYAATAKLNELFEAYKMLGYPEKRLEYDLDLLAQNETHHDWQGEYTVLKELCSYNILGLRYKVKRIKRKYVSKLGRHSYGQWWHAFILSMVVLAVGFWSILAFLLGIILAVIIFNRYVNNPYYLEEHLKEGKSILRTDKDTIVFDKKVFDGNTQKSKVPDTIGTIAILLAVTIILLSSFRIKANINLFSGFSFAVGYFWTLAFLEGLKIKKLRDEYQKEFVYETETNDIWIGREK